MKTKLSVLAALLIGLAIGPPRAQAQQTNSTTRYYTAFAYEDITVTNSAKVFTAATYNPGLGKLGASLASFSVTCASGTSCPITFRTDPSAASLTAGNGYQADYEMTVNVYNLPNIQNFNVLLTGATTATIHITYWQ